MEITTYPETVEIELNNIETRLSLIWAALTKESFVIRNNVINYDESEAKAVVDAYNLAKGKEIKKVKKVVKKLVKKIAKK